MRFQLASIFVAALTLASVQVDAANLRKYTGAVGRLTAANLYRLSDVIFGLKNQIDDDDDARTQYHAAPEGYGIVSHTDGSFHVQIEWAGNKCGPNGENVGDISAATVFEWLTDRATNIFTIAAGGFSSRKANSTRAAFHLDRNSTSVMDPAIRKGYLATVTTDAHASGMIHNLDVARNARVNKTRNALVKRCAGGADDTEGYMQMGALMEVGDSMFSNDDNVQLAVQGDGNFVLYARSPGGSWAAIWATNTGSIDPPFNLILQTNGNLVLYNARNAIWATGTSGTTYLAVQNDGNLVMYADGGGRQSTAVWASGTHV
ncbi:hypothetical protein HDU86_007898 [Geranomyces michiganensis]|nr:hypothetical protein HDU86_007898 [Geranomyces michiganensis]